MMALGDAIVWSFVPKRTASGYTLLDNGKTSTHLSWVAPTATNWEADSTGIVVPRFTNASDYAAASRRVSATVTQWSVVHWVKLRATGGSFPNSMDGNFNLTNVGPRLEHATGTAWIYSAGIGLVGISGGTQIGIGTWACYVITHDGNVTAKTYNQGRPTNATQTNSSGATGAFIGSFGSLNIGRGFNASRGYNGNIGGTIILGRQLTDAEVWQIYNAGPACDWAEPKRRRTYGFVPAGFRAYWARRQGQIIGGGV
jgi:hypothetical protein